MLSFHPSGNGNVGVPALPAPPHRCSMGWTLKASQKPIIDSVIGKSDHLCPKQFSQFQQRRLLAPRQRLAPPKPAERDITLQRARQRLHKPPPEHDLRPAARVDYDPL